MRKRDKGLATTSAWIASIGCCFALETTAWGATSRPLPTPALGAESCEVLGTQEFKAKICLLGLSESVAQGASSDVLTANGPEGSRVLLVRAPQMVEDFVRFERAPANKRLIYDVSLPGNSTYRFTNGNLAVADVDGHVRLHVERPWLVDASGKKWFPSFDAQCSPEQPHHCQFVIDWSELRLAYPIIIDPKWSVAPNTLLTGRQFHTATIIGGVTGSNNTAGKILITGGQSNSSQAIDLVELFDPITKQVTQCASMAQPRAYHTATWVAGGSSAGRLLIVGGYSCNLGSACDSQDKLTPLNTYEFYDPEASCTSAIVCDSYNHCPSAGDNVLALPDGLPRAEHTATVLSSNPSSGTSVVLIAGGTKAGAPVLMFDPTRPAGNSWIDNSMLVSPRFGHTATFVTPTPGTDSNQAIVFIAGGSAEPLTGGNPLHDDLIIIPFGGQTRAIPHDVDGGLSQLRPARMHSASLFATTHVLLLGGEADTWPADVDFAPLFEKGAKLPDWNPVPKTADNQIYSAAVLDATSIPSLRGSLLVGGLVLGQNCATSQSGKYYVGDTDQAWSTFQANLQISRTNHTLTAVSADKRLSAYVIGGVNENGSGVCRRNLQSTIETLTISGQGQPCSEDADCLTNHCVDGICCDKVCAHGEGSGTECQGCKTGVCKPLDSGVTCASAGGCGARTCDGVNRSCPLRASDSCPVPLDAGSGGTASDVTQGGTNTILSTTPSNLSSGGTSEPISSTGGSPPAMVPSPQNHPRGSFISCGVARRFGRDHFLLFLLGSALLLARRPQRINKGGVRR